VQITGDSNVQTRRPDDLCSIIKDMAGKWGNSYAIAKHNDSFNNVEFIWYSNNTRKYYYITLEEDINSMVNDEINYISKRYIDYKYRKKTKSVFKIVQNIIYFNLEACNCYYNSDLDLPYRAIKSRIHRIKYLRRRPLIIQK
jgi:hypothetical protein